MANKHKKPEPAKASPPISSAMADPLIPPRSLIELSGNQFGIDFIRAADERGELRCERDAHGNRMIRLSEAQRFLGSLGAKKIRIHKETHRRQAHEARERRRGNNKSC